MSLCKYCAKINAWQMAQQVDPWEMEKKFTGEQEGSHLTHHNSLEEMAGCAFDEQANCELCRLFLLSWFRVEPWRNHFVQAPDLDTDDEVNSIRTLAELSSRDPQFEGTTLYVSYGQRAPGLTFWRIHPHNRTRGCTLLGSLTFFLDRGSLAGLSPEVRKCLWPREISKVPSTASCLGVAAAWYWRCLEDHAVCRDCIGHQSRLPRRVIDVGGHGGHDTVLRLMVNDNILGRYVALSYCWGTSFNVTLTSQNLEQFQEHIPESSLPQTIRDAITVTRAVGLRYLWIDAFCILQDSKEDWAREASKMGNIFSDATLTILTRTASSSDQGFLKERTLPTHSPTCSMPLTVPTTDSEKSTWQDPTEILIRLQPRYRKGFEGFDEENRWGTRGWTLQEHLSAGRALNFDTDQMGWRCLTEIAKEDGTVEDQQQIQRGFIQDWRNGIHSRFPGEFADTWGALLRMRSRISDDFPDRDYDVFLISTYYQIVNQLRRRHFSFRSDMLPATAAIVMDVEKALSGRARCWAGLWDNMPVSGLLWSVKTHDNYDHHQPPLSKHSKWTPSWSWASVVECTCDAIITMPSVFMDHMSGSLLRDIRFPQVNTDQERLIPATELPLAFTAPYCRLPDDWILGVSPTKTFGRYLRPLREQLHRNIDLGNGRAEFGQKHSPHPGQHFAAVQILEYVKQVRKQVGFGHRSVPTTRMLILESISEVGGRYRRVSDLEVYTSQLEEIQDEVRWEEREVTLV